MIDNADIIEQTGALQKLSDADRVIPVGSRPYPCQQGIAR